MKYRKTVPILIDRKKDTSKNKKLKGHRRVTIPLEVRDFLEVGKGDYIEWEVDSSKHTLKGKLIRAERRFN